MPSKCLHKMWMCGSGCFVAGGGGAIPGGAAGIALGGGGADSDVEVMEKEVNVDRAKRSRDGEDELLPADFAEKGLFNQDDAGLDDP